MATKQDIRKRLIEVTREGPVTEWSERMAEVFRKAGFDTCVIAWGKSAVDVAHEIAEYALSRTALDQLEKAVYIQEEIHRLINGGRKP